MDFDYNFVFFKGYFVFIILRFVFKEVFNYKKVNFDEFRKIFLFIFGYVVMLDDNLDNIVLDWEDLF